MSSSTRPVVTHGDAHPVVGRRVLIRPGHTRAIPGRDIRAGHVLATGAVLEVEEIDGDIRLEMTGADIHYVGPDELVLVLAEVSREVLDGISLGTFLARAEQKRNLRVLADPTPHPTVRSGPGSGTARSAPVAEGRSAGPSGTLRPRPGRTNRGPLGRYDPAVHHFYAECSVHGETVFAVHAAGLRRDGTERVNVRCLACHTDYNTANLKRRSDH